MVILPCEEIEKRAVRADVVSLKCGSSRYLESFLITIGRLMLFHSFKGNYVKVLVTTITRGSGKGVESGFEWRNFLNQ